MRRLFSLLAVAACAIGPRAIAERNLERANAQGAVGEAGSLYVTPPGVFVHPLYNDVSGATDKLLSESLKVGRLWQYADSSYELLLRWRFLTPVYKRAFGHATVEHPIGRYADWLEQSNTYARTLAVGATRLKVQSTLGLNHVGDHGAKSVHTWVHKVTHNQTEYLQYTDQPEGAFLSGGGMLAWLPAAVDLGKVPLAWSPSVGVDTSKFMTESYAALNAVAVVREGAWEMGAEVRLVRQHESQVYESIRPGRYEVAFSTQLFHWNRPTIKYVSAYLFGDHIGQTYFDFLNVQMPLQ